MGYLCVRVNAYKRGKKEREKRKKNLRKERPGSKQGCSSGEFSGSIWISSIMFLVDCSVEMMLVLIAELSYFA